MRLRRKRERGSYDRAAIDAILDEALIAHLGIADEDGQPLVIPTLHARCGDLVYCHGSVAGRTLRALAAGAPVCLTVSLIDGLVLARSAMHHSANYRSVMLLGSGPQRRGARREARGVRGDRRAHRAGRWRDVRAPTENELKATAVLAIPIEEASAKVRSGPPLDDEEDYALDAWAGVIPLATTALAPEPDPRLRGGIGAPGVRQRLPAPRRPVTAQIGGGLHRAPARRLHLEQLKRTRAAVEQQTPVARDHPPRRPGRRAGRAVDQRRAVHAKQRPVGQCHARADVRMQRAHDALELGRGPCGIEQAILGADLLGVGDALLGLLDERRSLLEGAQQQLAADLRQAPSERAEGIVEPDRARWR